MTGGTDVIIVDVLLGLDIRTRLVIDRECVDEICLMGKEHVTGRLPFLHHELMGYLQTVENDIKYLNVISCRFAFAIKELKRTEVPVACHYQRMLVSKAIEVLGRKLQRPEGQR